MNFLLRLINLERKMKFKHLNLAILSTFTTMAATAQVSWQTSVSENWDKPVLSNNTASVVFIRANQSLGEDSNTNIAINNRYLTSLSEGHYTTDVVCAGEVKISIAPTKTLTNNLSIDPIIMQLKPRQVQYIYIEVDNQYRPTLNTLTEESAKRLIAQGYRQTHQISRTNAENCPVYQNPTTSVPVVPVVTPPPIIAPKSPVALQSSPVVQQAPSIVLNIHFDHDQDVIKPAYKGEINEAAKFLKNYPNMTATIEGYTDSTGDDMYNMNLSKRRAEAVRQALIKDYAVTPARLQSKGYGESKPIADNNTAEGRLQNRRVIIKVPAN